MLRCEKGALIPVALTFEITTDGAEVCATRTDSSGTGSHDKTFESPCLSKYGSHDKTFEPTSDGKMRVVTEAGETLMEHDVETGDIWRACQTTDIAIKDWVKLAVTRGGACGWPVIFWLDKERAHDAQIIAKVNAYLPEHDTTGFDIRIMELAAACKLSLERAKAGESTIPSLAMSCLTTTLTCSRSLNLNWAPVQKCFRLCRCSQAVACTRQVRVVLPPSTSNNSSRRGI